MAFWKRRRELEEQHDLKRKALEAELHQHTETIDRTIAAVCAEMGNVSGAALEFIRFFLENLDELPANFREYVTLWQKENISNTAKLENLKTELDKLLQSRADVRKSIFALEKEIFQEISIITHNYTSTVAKAMNEKIT